MTEYHKISTLFERDPVTFVVNPAVIKSPVLNTISEWDVDEKLDGTNIRINYQEPGGYISFQGRSDKAQLNVELLMHLQRNFTLAKLRTCFYNEDTPLSVVLYGEGYGAGIQKAGSLYRPDKSFALFDVLVDNRWWLERSDVANIATKLGIETVPFMDRMALPNIVEMVKAGFASLIGSAPAEGIVARPIQTLFDRAGKRIIIKLKTKDFVVGRR